LRVVLFAFGDNPLDNVSAHETGLHIVGVATGLYAVAGLAGADW
jgi:hypothetical protein